MTPPCKPGDRIRLLEMPDDPNPIPVGTTGTVFAVMAVSRRWDYQIGVDWDIERSLALVCPPDRFEVIG